MQYIASCSFGKDSLATIILARLHNEPIDEIIFSEVMYSHKDNISGESPDHINWVYNVAIPILEGWGYKVTVLKSDKDYLDCFHHVITKGKYVGQKQGFPMWNQCHISRDLKIKPMKDFIKNANDSIFYVGIAIDEPERLSSLKKDKKQLSLLEKYNYTEQMAYDLCEEYGLLSPLYKNNKRSGCWFCPNVRVGELRAFRLNNYDLWSLFLKLDNYDVVGVYKNKKSISYYDKKFKEEEKQLKLF